MECPCQLDLSIIYSPVSGLGGFVGPTGSSIGGDRVSDALADALSLFVFTGLFFPANSGPIGEDGEPESSIDGNEAAPERADGLILPPTPVDATVGLTVALLASSGSPSSGSGVP